MRHALRTTIASAIMAGGLVLAGGAAPAAADSGGVHSVGGRTHFNDRGDIYKVCDTKKDGMSAVGWIHVRQSDGTWNKYRTIKATKGKGDCTSRNVNVKREKAWVFVVSCRQDLSAGGSYRDCYGKYIRG